MSLLKCPKCGEMFSDSYKSCPFCAEDDAYFDGGVKPTRSKGRGKGSGRRLEGHDRGPKILGPALVIVLILLAGVLIYAFFGDRISEFIHRNDPKPVEVTLTVEPVEAELAVGEIRALLASGVETVKWTSSDEAVATVDEKGNVTAVGAGTATITATDEVSKLTARCEVTVKESQSPDPTPQPGPTPEPTPEPEPTPGPDEQGSETKPDPTKKLAMGATSRSGALDMSGNQYDVTLNYGSVHLTVIDTANKNAVVDSKNVTWTSSDSSKVTVDADGVITRKAGGNVIITAKAYGYTLECIIRG